MLKEGLFNRTYNQVPYSTVIECEAVAGRSDGGVLVQFRVLVEDENVQRMVIGTRGRNVDWVRAHFRASYAKMYGREAEVHVRVVVRRKRMLREEERVEEQYFQQLAVKDMEVMQDQLRRKGKILS